MKKILKESCIIYSVIYTITTIINSIIYLVQGISEDPSGNWHELDRAIILFIGMVAIQLFRKLELKNKILNIIFSYIPTLLLILGYVYIRGLRVELAQSAYKDVFLNFTIIYIIVLIVDFVVKRVKRINN